MAANARQHRAEGGVAREFADLVLRALSMSPSVAIELDDQRFWSLGFEISGGDSVACALVRRLRAEGLHGVFIDHHATVEELVQLAELLATDRDGRSDQDELLEAIAHHLGLRSVVLDIVSPEEPPLDTSVFDTDNRVARLAEWVGRDGAADGGSELTLVADRLRALSTGEAPGPEVVRLQSTPEHDAFQRECRLMERGEDAPAWRVGLVVFECLRGDLLPRRVDDLARALLGQIERALTDGRPEDAAELLQRPMMLADARLFPGWVHRERLSACLQAVHGPTFRSAIGAGFSHAADSERWVGPLFTLAQVTTGKELPSLLAMGSAMPHHNLRQAVADAAILVAERAGRSLRDLLDRAHDDEVACVLHALRRRPDPTLTELILARLSSDVPTVREAALVALREQQSPRIKQVVRAALVDPARAVRLEALRHVAVYRDAEAAVAILTRLCHAGADDAEMDEMRALARTYGIIRRDAAVDDLLAVVTGRRPAAHPQAARVAVLALGGLSAAGQQALLRLEDAPEDLRDDIRRAVGGGA